MAEAVKTSSNVPLKWKVACLILFATIDLSAPSIAGGEATEKPASQTADAQIPREKQTTLGLYVTAQEAYEKWKTSPKKVKILDVRTPEEFMLVGHAEMAMNIPLVCVSYRWEVDEEGKPAFAVEANREFVGQVKQWAGPTNTIMVMCRSGGRGAEAVNLLAAAGFENVYNIVDGMEGDTIDDPGSVFHGKRMRNGWKNSGLPWTYALNPKQMRLPVRSGTESGQ